MSAAAELTPIEDPRDCWSAPRPLFGVLNKRYRLQFDAAASDDNHMVDDYATINDVDGGGLGALKHTPLRMWVNPPYSDIEPWIAAAHARCVRDQSFTAMLLPANRTQMSWWHRYAMVGELWFFRGRIAFDPPPGIEKSTPRGNSVLVVFDPLTLGRGVIGSLDAKTGAAL